MNQAGSNGARPIHDAIVMSGWSWETFNVPERVALALAYLGAKVLYCQNPTSFIRTKTSEMNEVHKDVFRFIPQFFGHRANRVPFGIQRLQAKLVAEQVLRVATSLQLREPLFIYPHGNFFVPLCREFEKIGFRLVHVCLDYPEIGQGRLMELSDCTLTLSKSVFHQLRAEYGEKIALIPQVRWPSSLLNANSDASEELARIPRPRLGYIGLVSDRLNLAVLERLLVSRPDWHFVHFGESKCLPLQNVHAIAWRDPTELDSLVAGLDVGFMPYNCYNNKDFHCMPLKIFDYFHAGIPVVSTPIVNLWEYADTIYFGDSAEELAGAIQSALDEPSDSPRRAARMKIAERQTIEALAQSLFSILFLPQSVPARVHEKSRSSESVGVYP